MNTARKTLSLVQMCNRQISQTSVRRAEAPSAKFVQLKETQKKFQVDDGLPVYIKGGLKDKVLYQATLLLTAVGLAMGVEVLVTLALPKK